MSGGPLLTATLWDPGHPDRLAGRLDELTASAPIPVATTPGDLPGCRHLFVRTGELGLGLPEDPPEEWVRVGGLLGDLVVAAGPALALVATEWAAEGLLDPDFDVLRPGLTCGWVRTASLDAVRRERFARLAHRGTVRRHGDGSAWAALGAVPLDARISGEPGQVAEQVFWAWTGASPAESRGSARLVLGLPAGVGEDRVGEALPAGHEVLGVAGGIAVARPPAWAASTTTPLVEAGVLLDARWGVVEADEHGTRSPIAFWVPASRPDRAAELRALLPDASLTADADGTLLATTGSGADASGAAARLRHEWKS